MNAPRGEEPGAPGGATGARGRGAAPRARQEAAGTGAACRRPAGGQAPGKRQVLKPAGRPARAH